MGNEVDQTDTLVLQSYSRLLTQQLYPKIAAPPNSFLVYASPSSFPSHFLSVLRVGSKALYVLGRHSPLELHCGGQEFLFKTLKQSCRELKVISH